MGVNLHTCALFAYSHTGKAVTVIPRQQYETFVAHFHALCLQIGVRPASRALGISEERGKKIAQRRKFNIGLIRPAANGPVSAAANVPTLPQTLEAVSNIVQHYGDRAKIGATIAGAKAMEHLADAEGDTLVKPCNAIAADQWTKAVDRAAGWTAARQSPVQVAVQVNMPSAEEKAELRETDAKLDEIAALLRATRPQA